jgi:uncharacterized DUF497 family protein
MAGKAASNQSKHGVSFSEAATALDDPSGLDVHDPRHSSIEQRHYRVAMSARARIITVVYTPRIEDGKTQYRLISARPASRRERRWYATAPSSPDRGP